MDINQRKEQFSYAYLYAVASAAGYSFQIAARPMDCDGIDVILAGGSGQGIVRYPRLEIQVKCTSSDLMNDENIRYPLNIKNYDDLRVQNIHTPRILVIVVVPDTLERVACPVRTGALSQALRVLAILKRTTSNPKSGQYHCFYS